MTELWIDLSQNYESLLDGLWVSLRLALMTVLLGVPAGFILAMMTGGRSKTVRAIGVVVVEIGRGTPTLVVLQVVYFGLPATFGGFVAAFLALAFTTAAFSSEIIRGGLQAVPAGEVEAAEALGMRRWHTLRDIVIPQAMRIALPPLMGFCILMFQATSLAYTIAVRELTAAAKSAANQNFHYFNLFLIAGVLYAVVAIGASLLTEQVERRLARRI
jgi:polar amino acid transport system permease protein